MNIERRDNPVLIDNDDFIDNEEEYDTNNCWDSSNQVGMGSETEEQQRNEATNKVFVGNVPFQCSREDFQKCFCDMEGFINADIIRRFRSKLSRGFGFVVFRNKEQAESLINRTDIKIKDRVLRFSPYSIRNYTNTSDEPYQRAPYQVFINNLATETTNSQLLEALNSFDDVCDCNIKTKNGGTLATVKFDTHKGFKNALETPITINGVSLNVRPYQKGGRKINQNDFNKSFKKSSYQEGFRAGHVVGFQQGFQHGLNNRKLNSESVSDN